MSKEMTIYQPNVITQARYSFSDYEMRVLLFVVKQIQDLLNRDDVNFNRTLFGEIDYKVQFYLKDILGSDDEKNHSRVRKALKDLRQKSFEVNDEKQWFNVGFVNYGYYNKEAKKWELQVSFLLMPYMVSLAKGFTIYQLQTVLELNTHAQRLYMMFSQFHDTGIFRISAEDLRYKLALENAYGRYCDFKIKVLAFSLKEMKDLFNEGKSDLYVTLEDDKKVRGKEDWERTLTFKIFYSKRKVVEVEQAKAEAMQYCVQVLKSIFLDNQNYPNKLIGHLVQTKRLKAFTERLGRVEDEATETGKALSSFGGLIRHIAEGDYGFKG